MTFSFKIEGVSDLFITRGGHVVARFILSIVFDTVDSFVPEGVGGGGSTPCNCLYGEAPSERDTSFTLKVRSNPANMGT